MAYFQGRAVELQVGSCFFVCGFVWMMKKTFGDNFCGKEKVSIKVACMDTCMEHGGI